MSSGIINGIVNADLTVSHVAMTQPYYGEVYDRNVSSSLAIDEHNITIQGRRLSVVIEEIQKRLNILVPDPAKIEKYTALQEAYNHYKALEALMYEK